MLHVLSIVLSASQPKFIARPIKQIKYSIILSSTLRSKFLTDCYIESGIFISDRTYDQILYISTRR